jgi:hypothetical protein
MTPVQPQPIFLISANFQVAVADIIVATCKDESQHITKGIEKLMKYIEILKKKWRYLDSIYR